MSLTPAIGCAHGRMIRDCVVCHELCWALGLCDCTEKPTTTMLRAHFFRVVR